MHTMIFIQVGHIHRKIIINGANLCASGLSTALKDMVKMKSLLGIGKCGMSLILVIGKELSKSIVNFMTMQLMALKKLFQRARIGGPHSTDPSNEGANAFLRRFLEHCVRGKNYATGKIGSPLDYVGFHAKGGPRVIDNRVQMNIGRQLLNISKGFAAVASFPELKHLPIIIGESDPEGCAACSIEHHPQNAYRNGTMYSSYTAASFARKYELARKYGVNFIGAVSWSFEFENQAWYAGFRDLATNGRWINLY